MKEKNKKIFAVFMLPIVFSNSFPFLKIHLKKKEENPDIVQAQYSDPFRGRNIIMRSIDTTASVVTGFIDDMFRR